MKKILLTIIGLAMASPAWSSQTAVTEISGIQPSVGALKTQVNTKLGTVESNRQDHETRVAAMESGKETKAVVQASAPADTSVDWYDTDQESGVLILKRHNGTTWVRASSHGVQYSTSCASINGGMCVDTDDGKLYYHNGAAVVEVGTGGSGTTYTAGTGIDITSGVISSTVTGTLPPGTEGQGLQKGASAWEAVNYAPLAFTDNVSRNSSTGVVSVPVTATATSGSNVPLTSGGAYTALDGKQDTLVSGTSIKTVNNTSLLGAGNITIAGGTVTAIISEPYSDVACTGAKYDTVANRFYPCIGGYHTAYLSGTAYSTASPDTTPDAFTFGTTQTDAPLSTQYCSPAVTPTGFNSATSIVSTGTGSNKGWKIDGGSFATTGTLSPGSSIQTCHDSSASNSTTTTSSLTIGGVAATSHFTITTESAPQTYESIGNSVQGSTQLTTNNNGVMYLYPVSGTFTSGGTLESYTTTLRVQNGTRYIKLALYTKSGDIFTIVPNSGTNAILYTAAADKTNVTVDAPDNVAVTSGTQYYIATKQDGYAAFYGSSSTGTCYIYNTPYANSWPSTLSTTENIVASIGVGILTKQ